MEISSLQKLIKWIWEAYLSKGNRDLIMILPISVENERLVWRSLTLLCISMRFDSNIGTLWWMYPHTGSVVLIYRSLKFLCLLKPFRCWVSESQQALKALKPSYFKSQFSTGLSVVRDLCEWLVVCVNFAILNRLWSNTWYLRKKQLVFVDNDLEMIQCK